MSGGNVWGPSNARPTSRANRFAFLWAFPAVSESRLLVFPSPAPGPCGRSPASRQSLQAHARHAAVLLTLGRASGEHNPLQRRRPGACLQDPEAVVRPAAPLPPTTCRGPGACGRCVTQPCAPPPHVIAQVMASPACARWVLKRIHLPLPLPPYSRGPLVQHGGSCSGGEDAGDPCVRGQHAWRPPGHGACFNILPLLLSCVCA